MAAFSNQRPPFLADSLLLPNNTVKMTSFADGASDFNYFSSFSQFYSSGQLQEIAIDDNLHENTSRVERGIHNEASVIEIQSTDNSSSVVDHKTCYSDEQVTQNWTQMKKKRKANKEGSSSNSSSSKSVGEIKVKDQKKCNGVEEKQQKPYRRGDKKAQEEAPRDYIHVRARRGQATDSHSLAERVRRKKISEKMKLLQALVPGSDKVIGKALMLDEIINYVQSLQNQVEFLSMKLTSLTSMFFDFGADANAFMVGEQEFRPMGLPVPSVPSIHQCNSTAAEPMTCADATAFAAIVGTSATFPAAAESLLQQQQSPMPLSFQGSGSMYEEMGAPGDQRQNFIYQYGFEGSSLYSSF